MNTPETHAAHAVLAADVVLLSHRPGVAQRVHVLLVRRGHPPFAGCWALPGGRVAPDETLQQAARRELTEETGLTAGELEAVDLYDTPDRDPRGRVVSVAYLGMVNDLPTPAARDDATAARWVPLGAVVHDPAALAFDHHRILRDALTQLERHHWWWLA